MESELKSKEDITCGECLKTSTYRSGFSRASYDILLLIVSNESDSNFDFILLPNDGLINEIWRVTLNESQETLSD